MKTILSTLILLYSLLIFASSAMSLTVGTTDVGATDILKYATSISSGDQTELDWVQDVLNDGTITLEEKYNVDANDWQQTNMLGTWALPLTDNPSYFLIKTGRNASGFDHFLFHNNDSLSWAVVALSDFPVIEVQKFSHIGEFDGVNPVPEPATLLLLGTGLVSLGFFSRRRHGA